MWSFSGVHSTALFERGNLMLRKFNVFKSKKGQGIVEYGILVGGVAVWRLSLFSVTRPTIWSQLSLVLCRVLTTMTMLRSSAARSSPQLRMPQARSFSMFPVLARSATTSGFPGLTLWLLSRNSVQWLC
jgi:hypothetical protein